VIEFQKSLYIIRVLRIVPQTVLCGQSGNVLVSPVSVSVLLSMLQQGALERSRDELSAVLHLSPNSARDGYGHIARSLRVNNSTSCMPMKFEVFTTFNIHTQFSG
jgi:serine protease inhibitor